ncbi:MAG TPA: ELWxxDGT repeat protein [Archangium sp.]|uniref:ELWxxDGT repeat protein n=1 Tax=Archangium sp. TaxID=1872627 RepID=UPI002EDB828E
MLGETLFFSSASGPSGIWVSDGTPAGTFQLGPDDLFSDGPVVWNGRLYFFSRAVLRSSDGTVAGTRAVKDFGGIGYANTMVAARDGVFFLVELPEPVGGIHRQLWKSDGTEAGTVLVKDTVPGAAGLEFTSSLVSQGLLFFLERDAAGAFRWWRSDGTEAGTFVLETFPKEVGPPVLRDAPGGPLFLLVADGLWKSDGTEAGTVLVKDLDTHPASSAFKALAFKGSLLLSGGGATSSGVWRSDGSSAGTSLIHPRVPLELMELEATLLFAFSDELWRSDGTATGASRLKALTPSLNPKVMRKAHGLAYFPDFGQEADGGLPTAIWTWRSDGTVEGTFPLIRNQGVRDVAELPGTTLISDFYLWRTDGAVAGSTPLLDRENLEYPPEHRDRGLRGMGMLNGVALFTGINGAGRGLWRSDGTREGSFMLTPFLLEPFWRPIDINMEIVGGQALFSGDGKLPGDGLWITDGTREGTCLFKDFLQGPGGGVPSDLRALGSRLLFNAYDEVHGREPWVSEGTPERTVMLADIAPGALGSNPTMLEHVNGKLFFTADDGTHGRELWKSDGTLAGTVLAGDIRPGPGGSNPEAPALAVGDRFYFLADDGVHGREMWGSGPVAPGTSAPPESPVTWTSPCRVNPDPDPEPEPEPRPEPTPLPGCGCGAVSPGVALAWALALLPLLARRGRRSPR